MLTRARALTLKYRLTTLVYSIRGLLGVKFGPRIPQLSARVLTYKSRLTILCLVDINFSEQMPPILNLVDTLL